MSEWLGDVNWVATAILTVIFNIITWAIIVLLNLYLGEKYGLKVRGKIKAIKLRNKEFKIHLEKTYKISDIQNNFWYNLEKLLEECGYTHIIKTNGHVDALSDKEPCKRIDIAIDIPDIFKIENNVKSDVISAHLKLTAPMKFKLLPQTLATLRTIDDNIRYTLQKLGTLQEITTKVDIKIELEDISEIITFLDLIHAKKIIGYEGDYEVKIDENNVIVTGPPDENFIKLIRNVMSYS